MSYDKMIGFRDVRLKDLFYFGVTKDRTKMRKEFMCKTVGPDFPIILTTYWMAMTDEQRLTNCEWKYVVVDEGRELKKWEFELLDKLKGLPMDHKLLLIRSPFQNNLAELWSRLNFVMPRMFSSREEFDSWFDFPGKGGEEQQHEEKRALLSKLHAILRPFLRRQMEEDIENRVPQKKDIKNRVPQKKDIENRVPQKKVVTCYRNLFPSDNLLSSQYALEGNVVKRARTNAAPRPTSTLEECNNSFQAPSKPAVLVQVPNSTSSELIFKSLKEIPELARSDILRYYSALVRDDRQFESLMALPMDMRKDWLLMEIGNK
ncbi:hypothetical protein BRADI_3g36465v3 [Brachypodium distachyon]|uniref:Helicase ATP-binding domain-containing protein n=1 Tax=Brachypodium distachyon TaxID=15368 RepID=A0A2K2D1K6_BRADI|nr:hypothetical protein BRADI_3g36465v3 [Brachypodium distachyon]PNT68133.1 hypothetical protein BRADI_3g36465v3 [Brachypodium distachyon]